MLGQWTISSNREKGRNGGQGALTHIPVKFSLEVLYFCFSWCVGFILSSYYVPPRDGQHGHLPLPSLILYYHQHQLPPLGLGLKYPRGLPWKWLNIISIQIGRAHV